MFRDIDGIASIRLPPPNMKCCQTNGSSLTSIQATSQPVRFMPSGLESRARIGEVVISMDEAVAT